MDSTRKLFEPIAIRQVAIKNRYVMAPMGNIGYVDSQGAFTQRGVDYFAARAKGGVGLIITGLCEVASQIERIEPMHIPSPRLNPTAFKYTATEMVERVHAYNCKIFLQLTAGFGYAGKPGVIRECVAPSATENRWDPRLQHRALTRAEIYEFIAGFAESAQIAQACGFDGVEIHAVHEGYLLDQFTMAFYNQRTDEFGGDIDGRLKFPIEVVKAIKAACGEEFPVILRFSLKSFIKGRRQGALPGEAFNEQGRDIDEGVQIARLLVDAGYDALDVDAGTYDSWYWNHPPMYFGKKGIYLEFSRLLKQQVTVPIIVAGRMDDAELANQALLRGDCDMVALGRPLLADPELPNKVYQNQFARIRPCLSCHEGCMGRFGHGAPLSCAVNPACGREETYGLLPALEKKQVLIVGGGIAGMEVARVAALRGHRVDLYEQSDALGGVVIPGSQPPFKSDDRDLLRWYQAELSCAGVNVHCQTTMTRASILAAAPDVVVIATGAQPIVLNIPNPYDLPVYTASEVLMNTELVGKRVAVIGAGLVGAELGLWLTRLGREVHLIEASDHILGGVNAMPFMNYEMLKDLLNHEQVAIHLRTRFTRIVAGGIEVTSPEGKAELAVDAVVYAIGYRANDDLYQALAGCGLETYLLGDARNVRNIMYAIWDAYEVARNL